MRKKLRLSSVLPFILVALVAFSLGVKSTEVNLSWHKKDTVLPEKLDYSSVDGLYDQLKAKFDSHLSGIFTVNFDKLVARP